MDDMVGPMPECVRTVLGTLTRLEVLSLCGYGLMVRDDDLAHIISHCPSLENVTIGWGAHLGRSLWRLAELPRLRKFSCLYARIYFKG
jgi:hypothetical protein